MQMSINIRLAAEEKSWREFMEGNPVFCDKEKHICSISWSWWPNLFILIIQMKTWFY